MTDAAVPETEHSFAREAWEIAKTFAAAGAIAVALRIVVFQPFTIPSSSMEPGLRTGDYVVVSKFAYGWSRASVPWNPPLPGGRLFGRQPHRGDVIVFRLPRDPQVPYVKRLIGLPGDRVQVKDGEVFVNGQAIARTPIGRTEDPEAPGVAVTQVLEHRADGRPYVTYDRGAGYEGDDTGVYVVPAGEYFMMGDNRDNSLDSRWPKAVGVGFVPAENLMGKVEFTLISWKEGASALKPWTWFNLRPGRFLQRTA